MIIVDFILNSFWLLKHNKMYIFYKLVLYFFHNYTIILILFKQKIQKLF